MKIAILSFGTRGDVQPYIALAKALQARGDDVLLGAPDNFASWVESHGLPFRPLGIDMEAFLRSPEVREVLSGSLFGLAKLWQEKGKPMIRGMLEATWQAGRDADVIVHHPKVGGAPDVAEATGARPICASPVPVFPTGDFPVPVSSKNLGRGINRLTYAGFKVSRLPYYSIMNSWRSETLGLRKGPRLASPARFEGRTAPRLCAVSPAVVPRPADWHEAEHMTGYWFLDEGPGWEPDPALAAFLDAGEPPVYIGFGSMTAKDPARLASDIVEGVRQAGVRAILATGWGGIGEMDVPPDLHVIHGAPHDALFPRVSAVVHHGGAGTTAAGLRAARPTLVCPFGLDQPFWAKRVSALGCGPPPQPLKRLRAGTFGQALADLVRNESYRENACVAAKGIARDDGIARAMEVITG